MKTYNRKIPLLSIHIPKCGGTSFRVALQSWFGERIFEHYFNEKKNTMPVKHQLKRGIFRKYLSDSCVHGHFNARRGFGVSDYYPEIKQAITFVREPLEIALSTFNYNQKMTKEGNNFRNGEKREMTKDIDEFLETTNSFLMFFFPAGVNRDNLDDFFNNYFVHVGIMENYQESMNVLADKLNKPRVIIPHENSSERSQSPSESSIKKFKDKCAFEYEVYNKALKLHK